MMKNIKKIINLEEKIACITIDFEKDYGDRIDEFNILKNTDKIKELAEVFKEQGVGISAFIRTDVLEDYPRSLDAIKMIASDFHTHSHTHNTKSFQSKNEISESAQVFKKYFHHAPLGYRAPMGVLYDGDIEIIKECGFKFSASTFPSYRPKRFNNLSMPVEPFVYDNGIVELPFATVPGLRYTISLSYLKLLGFDINNLLYSIFGLPNVLVFDSHLHDYIINEESFAKLPLKLKIAWGINKHSGISYFKRFASLLKKKGYRFVTMSELYNIIEEKYL